MIVPTPVTLKYILPKDRWILNYKISFVHLNKLMSKREYGLLIITPQTSEMPTEYPEYPSRFLLLGVVKGGGKYSFVLDPSKLRANAKTEYVICLDFAGNLFDQNRIGIDPSIEMISDDPDKQVSIQRFPLE